MSDEHSIAAFARDRRAHIPYAIIALLLLLSAVGLIVSLETRSSPDIEQDPSLTMDRTEATLETVLRDAIREASLQAAAEPVTVAADNAYGEALTPSGVDPGDGDPDTVFTRYVKLLIYQETQQRASEAGQELRDGTHTEVRMAPVDSADDAEAAIDNVTLSVGGDELDYGDPTGEEVGHGNVKARIDGIEVELRSDGETLDQETMSLNTTVATPVFDLHERVGEYERQLNMDFRGGNETRGLGDYVARHAYPFMWTRGQAQARGAPIANVLEQRHLEVLANEGIYAAQERIFGDADRFAEQSLTRAWGATLAQDYRGAYQTPDGDSDDVANVVENVTDAGFVNGSNYIYDDVGVEHLRDELGDEPKFEEIAWFNGSLQEQHRINLTRPAETVFGELESNHGIENAIDRIYSMSVTVDSDVERTVMGGSDADPEELLDRQVEVTDISYELDETADDTVREFYDISFYFNGEYETESGDLANIRYDVNLTIVGEHSPGDRVERRGIDFDYTTGPTGTDSTMWDTNFRYDESGQFIPEKAVEESISGIDDADDAATQLKNYILDETSSGGSIIGDSVVTQEDLLDLVVEGDGQTTIQPEPDDRVALRGWAVQELRELKNTAANVSTTADRSAILSGDSAQESPFRSLADSISEDDNWVYFDVGTHYENAPAKVRAEVRLEFIERLRDRVDHAITRHEDAIAELNGEITGHTESDIENATIFANRTTAPGADDPSSTYLQRPELLGDVSIAPNAEPNYLTFEAVNLTQVSATGRPDGGFVPLAGRVDHVYPSPYDQSTVELRVAGEVLSAGNATDDVAAPGWDGGNLAGLESSLEGEIDAIIAEAATTAAAPFASLGPSDIEPKIRAEVEQFGSIANQSIKLGSSERAWDRVAGNVSDEIDRPLDGVYWYFDDDFDDHLQSAVRYGLGDAIDQGMVGGTTATLTRDVGNSIRSELDAANDGVLQQRLNESVSGGLDTTAPVTDSRDWLESNRTAGEFAPARNPSGRYLPAVPDWHELTANLWHVDLRGEYARFAVQASYGSNTDTGVMTYVREPAEVTVEFGGVPQTVGNTTKVTFESTASVVVGVEPDLLGVGDRAGPADWCSSTYDEVGAIDATSGLGSC